MGGDTMNNGMSQQNDTVNQPINQVPLTRTIDGIYRQKVNNYTNHSQIYPQQIAKTPIQEQNIYTPAKTDYETIASKQSLDGIYKQPTNGYQNNFNNDQYNNIQKNTNQQYTPNYRSTKPITHLQSVDGMTASPPRPNKYNNYNQLYQQTINAQYNEQVPQPQKFANHSQPQTQKHIPVTTPPKPVEQSTQNYLDNNSHLEQQNMHNQMSSYSNNKVAKAKNTTYLDIINTFLLLSILSVTILILLKI